MPRIVRHCSFDDAFTETRDACLAIARANVEVHAALLVEAGAWLDKTYSASALAEYQRERAEASARMMNGQPDLGDSTSPRPPARRRKAASSISPKVTDTRASRLEWAVERFTGENAKGYPRRLLGNSHKRGQRETNALRAIVVAATVLDPDSQEWLGSITELAMCPWDSDSLTSSGIPGRVKVCELWGNEALELLREATAILRWNTESSDSVTPEPPPMTPLDDAGRIRRLRAIAGELEALAEERAATEKGGGGTFSGALVAWALAEAIDLYALEAPAFGGVRAALRNVDRADRSHKARQAAWSAYMKVLTALAIAVSPPLFQPPVGPLAGDARFTEHARALARLVRGDAFTMAERFAPTAPALALRVLAGAESWRFTELPIGISLDVLRVLDVDGFIEVHSWGAFTKCDERGHAIGGFDYGPMGARWYSPTAQPMIGGDWEMIARKALDEPRTAVEIRVSALGKAELAKHRLMVPPPLAPPPPSAARGIVGAMGGPYSWRSAIRAEIHELYVDDPERLGAMAREAVKRCEAIQRKRLEAGRAHDERIRVYLSDPTKAEGTNWADAERPNDLYDLSWDDLRRLNPDECESVAWVTIAAIYGALPGTPLVEPRAPDELTEDLRSALTGRLSPAWFGHLGGCDEVFARWALNVVRATLGRAEVQPAQTTPAPLPAVAADAIDENDLSLLVFLNQAPNLRRKVADVLPDKGPQDRKAVAARLRRLADRSPALVDYPKGGRSGVVILPAGVDALKRATALTPR